MNDAAADEEIVEIFIEEAGEVLETMDANLATWKRSPGDKHALTEIRRGFHTLKGSGRMVKALDLAEMAWKVENMLNRAMDGTVSVSEPMVKLVGSARDLMPRLVDAFKGNKSIAGDSDVELLMAQADALAEGKAVPTTSAAPRPAVAAAVPGEEDIRFKLADFNRKLDRVMQRADEALHRSEMALQQVRRVTSQIKALDSEAQDRVSKAEMSRVGERLNFLTKELLELRLVAKRVQQEAASPHPKELNQLVDHRFREKVAPLERLHADLERQLAAARQAAASSRTMAVASLVLSLLIGGVVAAGVVMVLMSSG